MGWSLTDAEDSWLAVGNAQRFLLGMGSIPMSELTLAVCIVFVNGLFIVGKLAR